MPPIPYISDALLNPFTAKIYTTLPREVRDMIYVYLLEDEETFERIYLSAQPSMDGYPVAYSTHTAANLPPFLKTSVAHPEFVKEAIGAFYEMCQDFSVILPSKIASLLKEDFFRVGVAPKHGILSALKVNGSLDDGFLDYIDAAQLTERFAPLLDNKQCWAKGFRLSICIETYYVTWPILHTCDEIPAIAHLVDVLNELKPILQAVQGKPRKGTIVVNIKFCGQWRTPTMAVKAEHMEISEKQWMQQMNTFLGF